MVKKKEKGLSHDLIVGIIAATLGAVAGAYATVEFTPPDIISKERNDILIDQTTELNRQANALEGGFDKLSKALVQNNQADPKLLAILDGLSQQVGSLAKSSNKITKSVQGTVEYEEGTFIVLINETREIDNFNEISVRGISENTNRIYVTLNGKKFYMEPGDRRPYIAKEGKDCYIVYKKKESDISFQFLKKCQ